MNTEYGISGCSIHGPGHVCGHTTATCPDQGGGDVLVSDHEIATSNEVELPSNDPRDYFLQTAMRKMGREIDTDPMHPWEVAENVVVFNENEVYFIPDQYSNPILYAHIFNAVIQWVLDSSDKLQPKYNVFVTPKLARFPIEKMVKRPVSSVEDVRAAFAAMPFKQIPNLQFAKRSVQEAEFVELGKVVGFYSTTGGWAPSDSEGRGLSHVFDLAQKLQDGSVAAEGRNAPIKVVELDGEYYVEDDGRHRTAALKVLGVERAPMIVQHVI